MSGSRKKVAIICQRYGIEVNGGAEYHARLLAEKLFLKYDVTVLTTTAVDYHSWENYYKQGSEYINGILVNRFPTIAPTTSKQLRKSRRIVLEKRKYFKLLKTLGIFNFLNRWLNLTKVTQREAFNWLKNQGPYCPLLIKYIADNKNEYDVFIFFTYLYYPTAVGMPLVKNKALFIPTAHDEPPLYFSPYKNIFAVPKFIMYNTPAEKKLVEKHFEPYTKANNIAGVGITGPIIDDENKPHFPNSKYFLYIGRIEPNKGCDELISYFERYCTGKDIKLVMIGKYLLSQPTSKNVISTGFIAESDKNHYLKNCNALIIPSKYESLSLVALEAMRAGKLIIVNGQCEVLKDHVENSNSGFYYENFDQFCSALDNVLNMSEEEENVHRENAIMYVEKNYSWDSILQKFDKAIDYITNSL
ncbi:MAG TPA: glycosyltransferase [Niabella sp.]|nr:glycosyltransferase [Niabella sp.]